MVVPLPIPVRAPEPVHAAPLPVPVHVPSAPAPVHLPQPVHLPSPQPPVGVPVQPPIHLPIPLPVQGVPGLPGHMPAPWEGPHGPEAGGPGMRGPSANPPGGFGGGNPGFGGGPGGFGGPPGGFGGGNPGFGGPPGGFGGAEPRCGSAVGPGGFGGAPAASAVALAGSVVGTLALAGVPVDLVAPVVRLAVALAASAVVVTASAAAVLVAVALAAAVTASAAADTASAAAGTTSRCDGSAGDEVKSPPKGRPGGIDRPMLLASTSQSTAKSAVVTPRSGVAITSVIGALAWRAISVGPRTASKLVGGFVDTVLGVSMAPTTVRIVLVEGENADGATVDEDNFAVTNGDDPATFSAPDQVVAAILGTREGANEAGYDLLSTGVTWSDQCEAAELRDALAARKVENVMLVSSFLAAAALAQSMGSATGYARAALLYVEPDTATLAVVDTTDGSITDVQREQLPDDDDQAVATLVSLVSAAEGLDEQPDGLLVVGSGVDIPLIKPALEEATSLPLSVPEQPDDGAGPGRGAGVGECTAVRFVDRRTGLRAGPGHRFGEPARARAGYLAVAEAVPSGEPGAEALAYSAVADDSAAVYTQLGPDAYVADDEHEDFTTGMYPDFSQLEEHEHVSRTPFLAAMSVLIIFVAGVMALVISLAFSIRPSASSRPSLSHNVVAPARLAPLPAPPPARTSRRTCAGPGASGRSGAGPRSGGASARPDPLPRPAPGPRGAAPADHCADSSRAPTPAVRPAGPLRAGPWGHGDEGWGHGGGPGWGHGGGGGGWGHGGGGLGPRRPRPLVSARQFCGQLIAAGSAVGSVVSGKYRVIDPRRSRQGLRKPRQSPCMVRRDGQF